MSTESPVQSQWIEIAAGFEGFLSLPPAGRGPGLLMWQEIFGVNPHIRACAEQWALHGFVVLAPDVFWRSQVHIELGYTDADIARGRALKDACAPADLAADLAAAAAALRARPEAAGPRIGSIGWCFGGRLAYESAAAGLVDAAVPFYGGGISTLLDRAPQVRCPIQFHHAENDHAIPLDAVGAIEAAFAGRPASGAGAAEFHLHAAAQHGFNCWARASYHAATAARAHAQALRFLCAALY